MADQSAPPNFYNSMAQMGGGASAPSAPGAGAPAAGGADGSEALLAVSKVVSVLKKLSKMQEGSGPYIDRAIKPLYEMVVDVLKKDPKDLDAASATPPAAADAPPPAPDAGAVPSAGAPAQ